MSRTPSTFRNVLKSSELYMPLFTDGRRFIIYDTETTGLHGAAKIIQFAAVLYQVRIVNNTYVTETLGDMNVFINPQEKLAPKIIEITKLTDSILCRMPTEREVIQDILCFMSKAAVWGGYNEAFDDRMFNLMLERTGRSIKPLAHFDVLKMAKDMIPKSELPSHKLESVFEYLHPDAVNDICFHEALDDVKATGKVLEHALNFYSNYEYEPGEKQTALLEYASAYINPRAKSQQRIRLKLNIGDPGDIFWDVAKQCWNCKSTSQAKGIFQEIDMINLEMQVLNKYRKHGESMDDIGASLLKQKRERDKEKTSLS